MFQILVFPCRKYRVTCVYFSMLSSQFFFGCHNLLFLFLNAVLYQQDSSDTWEDHVADGGPLQKVCICFVALIVLSYNAV